MKLQGETGERERETDEQTDRDTTAVLSIPYGPG